MRNLYVILDKLAQDLVSLRMYTIITFRTHQEAARYFADAINDTSSVLNKHPEDYDLLYIGNLGEGGELSVETPFKIANGADVLGHQEPAKKD